VQKLFVVIGAEASDGAAQTALVSEISMRSHLTVQPARLAEKKAAEEAAKKGSN
jgi:hypothetical protein